MKVKIGGELRTKDNGLLSMKSSSDSVVVEQDAEFAGGRHSRRVEKIEQEPE